MKSSRGHVLVVDDDPLVLDAWREALGDKHDVHLAPDARRARLEIDQFRFDVALLDVQVPGESGLSLLKHLRARQPDAEAIMITGNASIPLAIESMRLGALDFLCKPIDDLAGAIRRIEAIVERKRAEVRGGAEAEAELIGTSRTIEEVRLLVDRFAPATAPVLILGESGTGKELVARMLHRRGSRASQPFIAVNCGALPDSLVDSELFGHERGAFTGALGKRRGLFEAAHGGVLFLDEVGELPAPTQVRLLRALQEGEIRPVGAEQSRTVDVRTIAATNLPLERATADGRFRQDLYYRLRGFQIEVPTLRERREDIPLLTRHFLERQARKTAQPQKHLSTAAERMFQEHDWPGNVRELRNAVEYGATMSDGAEIEAAHLPASFGTPTSQPSAPPPSSATITTYREARSEFDRRYLEALLTSARGNISQAARLSGIDRPNLRRLLARHGLRGDKAGPLSS